MGVTALVAKSALLSAALASALWGFKHTDMVALKSFLRALKIEPKSEASTCGICLAAGKDFCISSNRCIPRATLQCDGPHDHITGDKEFALHGNPHGIQHSMVCPKPEMDAKAEHMGKGECPCKAARRDCITDNQKIYTGKCVKLWDACVERRKKKMSKSDVSWSMCAVAKTRCMKDGEKVLEGRCGSLWKKCGAEWETRAEGKHNMCMIAKTSCMKDGEKVLEGDCGDKWKRCGVEWKVHDEEKHNMCMIAKTRCMKDGEKVFEGRCGSVWEWCGTELKKGTVEKEELDKKDCYFQKDCHEKVDWTQISKLKEGIFGRLKTWKRQEDKSAVRDMMPKVRKMFADAGMPEDRIDYMLFKWVKSVYPEALEDKQQLTTLV